MKDVLQSLNQIPSVQGSMVITRDGILVASELGPNLSEDAVAALSSSLVLTLKRSLTSLDIAEVPEEIILSATQGKLVFCDLGRSFLVVVTQANLRLKEDFVDIRSSANKLRARSTLNAN